MLWMSRNVGWLAGAVLVLLSAGAQAGAVDCTGPVKISFPTFDSSCRDGRDCRAGIHQINCCGTRRALGINYLEVMRFDQAEAICESQFPACNCADQGIFADDGQSAPDPSRIGVFCNEGSCTTFVIPGG